MRYIRSLERKDLGLDTLDDSARLVHDEAERGNRDAADDVAGFSRHASVRAGRAGRGLSRRSSGSSRRRSPRSPASRPSRFSRTQARRASSRAAGDSRVSPRRAARATRRRADSRLGARHQPGQRGRWPACASCRGAATADGNVDVDDLQAKAAEHRDRLARLMVTYPSTHGVFEDASERSATSCTRTAARCTWTART